MSRYDFRSAMRTLGFLLITAAAIMGMVLIGIVAFIWIGVILP